MNEQEVSYRIVLPNRETDYIQKGIVESQHPYELEMLEDMASRLQPGDRVLDVGANIGNHTMYLAAVAGAQVTAFEPNAPLATAIRQSAALNELSEAVSVIEAGAGREAGRAYFSTLKPENLGAQSLSLGDSIEASIKIVTLDDIEDPETIRMIKIDVEGMEMDVLRGAEKLLSSARPLLYVESRTYEEFEEISSYLRTLGYHLRDSFNKDITNLFTHKEELGADYDETLLRQLLRHRYYLKNGHDRRESIARDISGRLSFAWEKFHAEVERSKTLTAQIDELRAARESADSHANKANLQLETLRKDLDAAERDKKELTDSNAALNQQLRAETQRLEALRQDLHAAELREKELAETKTRKLLEHEKELASVRKELSETANALARAQAEIPTSGTAQKISGLAAELSKSRETLAAIQSAQAQTTPDGISTSLQHALVRDQDLRWTQPLLELFRLLKIKPVKLANAATALAKKRYVADPFARLLLASLAASVDPEPFRQKWLAFRLKDMGFNQMARQIIAALQGQVDFSASEQRVADHLLGRASSPPAKLPATSVKQTTPAAPLPSVRKPAAFRPAAPRTAKLPKDMKVALLCDEFSYLSFKDEFNAVTFEPSNWQEAFESNDFDLFFCESAWSGVDSDRRPWKGKVYASERFAKENRTELLGILDTCRERGIPTVFWNKEDPAHYEDRVHDFVKTAQLFDHVMTTAEECVPRYKDDYGCKSVAALPFATNPKLYNPIENGPRSRSATFAGSWYSYFPDRCADMETIFHGILDAGIELEIYDRYYGNPDPIHLFPDEFKPYIRKNVPADRVPDVFKSAVYGININSITDSTTMFARRAFELMSSNTFVISNYSRGMEEMFGDVVLFADKHPERLKSLSESDIERMRDEALHLVLEHHTYENRFLQVLDLAQIPYLTPATPLTLVADVRDDAGATAAIRRLENTAQHLQGARKLLLVDKDVPDTEVAAFYEKYNRYGVDVLSEGYALTYAKPDQNLIETPWFALVGDDTAEEKETLKKAVLHLKYFDGDLMHYGSDHKYLYEQVKVHDQIIGKGGTFLDTIRDRHSGASKSAYCI
ncbi:MAG: hypothetical protein CMF06_11205 [Hyphomonas sp.]|nr:hypothetical protein [Hyphomonas sp.]